MPSRRSALVFASWLIPAAGCSSMKSDLRSTDLLEQVRQSELAFAATMSARDLRAFAGFIAEDAVFINGGQPLRGKAAIVQYWERFFSGAAAPALWKPDVRENGAA